MLAISLLRVVFDAWHSVAVDARKTKEYFEVSNKYMYVQPCSSLDPVVRFRTRARDTALCSWARHITGTHPHSASTGKLNAGGNLTMD